MRIFLTGEGVKMRKTVLDLIPVSEIEKWQPGDHVLVVAGTGRCKTTWVKQVLWPCCKEHGLSLFTLANRSMLRDDIRHGTDMPVLTYQLLEQQADHPAWNADVIVMDECQSLATDVLLDCRRNKMMHFFRNQKTIVIGLTATPVECVTALFDQSRIYCLERDYSQLESVTLFFREKEMIAILEKEMKREGRILCFVRSAATGFKLHQDIPNTAFICSDNAEQCTPEIKQYKKDISRRRKWGEAKVLFATKVMDVGVSIEDPDVHVIIVETEDYYVDLIQMIGRIRCADGQRIRLYIRVFPQNYLSRQKRQLVALRNKIEIIAANPDELKYDKNLFPLILMDGQQNELAVRWLDQQIKDLTSKMEDGAEQIISDQLCSPILQIWAATDVSTKKLEMNVARHQTQMIIDELGDRCMYDRKELYSRFTEIVPSVLKKGSLRPTLKTINEALQRMELPYTVGCFQQSRGFLRGKYYYRIDHVPAK